MSLELVVDSTDPTPPYEQVRRQLADLIDLGLLRAGDRLPPLRQLSRDLGLAVGTVGRAYAELEASGHLTSHRGAGTRVAVRQRPSPSDDVLSTLTSKYLARARTAGFGDAQIRAALDAALGPTTEE